MATIKAKFRCDSVEKFKGQNTAKLSPVPGDSAENKTYSMYTPYGQMTIAITNPDVMDFFEPGQDYVLDINKAN